MRDKTFGKKTTETDSKVSIPEYYGNIARQVYEAMSHRSDIIALGMTGDELGLSELESMKTHTKSQVVNHKTLDCIEIEILEAIVGSMFASFIASLPNEATMAMKIEAKKSMLDVIEFVFKQASRKGMH